MIEIKLYELLGVRTFQKMVFCLEKIIHWKDKGKNINYHFRDKDKENDFIKYLFFNGSIHIRNIIIILIYLFIKAYFFKPSFFDIVIILFAIKDIYCVLLQRYNFLRIQFHLRKKEETRKKRIEEKIDRIHAEHLYEYDIMFKNEDLKFIKKLKQSITNKEYIILNDSDIVSLERLCKLLYGNEKLKEETHEKQF